MVGCRLHILAQGKNKRRGAVRTESSSAFPKMRGISRLETVSFLTRTLLRVVSYLVTCWLVGRLVGPSIGRLVCRRSVIQFVDQSMCRLVSQPVTYLVSSKLTF